MKGGEDYERRDDYERRRGLWKEERIVKGGDDYGRRRGLRKEERIT